MQTIGSVECIIFQTDTTVDGLKSGGGGLRMGTTNILEDDSSNVDSGVSAGDATRSNRKRQNSEDDAYEEASSGDENNDVSAHATAS